MLPFSYNQDRLIMLPVDPNTLFAYWDFSTDTWHRLSDEGATHLVLTLHSNGQTRTFATGKDTRNYYFKGVGEDKTFWLSLEAGYAEGRRVLMESSAIKSPANRPSENRLVRFRKFQFLEPPARPGVPATNWRDYYRYHGGRYGVYADFNVEQNGGNGAYAGGASGAAGAGHAGGEAGAESLFYYEGGGEALGHGGSSGGIPTSPGKVPSSHSVGGPSSFGGVSSDFKSGGASYGEQLGGVSSSEFGGIRSGLTAEPGGVSSDWPYKTEQHSSQSVGGPSSTSPMYTFKSNDGKRKE